MEKATKTRGEMLLGEAQKRYDAVKAKEDPNGPVSERVFIDDFMEMQDYATRVAYALHSLYGQVCNGGFGQWHDNGYGESTRSMLLNIMNDMTRCETRANRENRVFEYDQLSDALDLARKSYTALKEDEEGAALDKLDTKFYDLEMLKDQISDYIEVVWLQSN